MIRQLAYIQNSANCGTTKQGGYKYELNKAMQLATMKCNWQRCNNKAQRLQEYNNSRLIQVEQEWLETVLYNCYNEYASVYHTYQCLSEKGTDSKYKLMQTTGLSIKEQWSASDNASYRSISSQLKMHNNCTNAIRSICRMCRLHKSEDHKGNAN